MRLSKSILFTLLLSVLLLNSCGKCRKCKGDREGILLVQGKFSSIDLMMPGKITIIEDPEIIAEQFVIMRGPTAHLEAINRIVDGTGKWSVIFGQCVSDGCADVDILVVVKDFSFIKTLTVSDAGTIFADTMINVTDLTLNMTGSGQFDFKKLFVTNLTTNLSGSGTVNVKGSGTNLNLDITGSGIFEGFDYTAQNATVNNTANGTAKVKASNTLSASISGSGNILYKGNPDINEDITGTGELIDSN